MRPIDADALKEYILRSVPNWSEDREIMLDCIANSPTIEERKDGKWIGHKLQHGLDSIDEDTCSECGERFYQIAETGCAWNYCPNCGSYNGGET